jgi:hypothetical protein
MEELKSRINAKYNADYKIDIISDIAGKKLLSYLTIKDDLNLCLELVHCLNYVQLTGTLATASTYTLIASYAKGFTDASKQKAPKLEPSIFQENKNHLQTHNRLMSLRHNFIAHRGMSEGEKAILFMITPKLGLPTAKSILKYERKHLQRFSSDDLKMIESLILFVLRHTETKIDNIGERMYNSFYDDPRKFTKL